MLTTPAQRAEWAKLADSITGTSYPDGDDAVKLVDAAVPALCQDVEVLEAKLASEEKVSDELAEMAGKYQHDWETAQAQVERLTALLRDLRSLLDGLSVDGFWTDPKTSEPYWVCHLKMTPGEFGKLSIHGKRAQIENALRCRIEKELEPK